MASELQIFQGLSCLKKKKEAWRMSYFRMAEQEKQNKNKKPPSRTVCMNMNKNIFEE